jgi:hypothetical protein
MSGAILWEMSIVLVSKEAGSLRQKFFAWGASDVLASTR